MKHPYASNAWAAKIAGYHHVVHVAPSGSHFSKVNIIGNDFCVINQITTRIHDDHKTVTYYIGKKWDDAVSYWCLRRLCQPQHVTVPNCPASLADGRGLESYLEASVDPCLLVHLHLPGAFAPTPSLRGSGLIS